MSALVINCYGNPQSQGSAAAYVRGGRAVVTSANKKLRPWRDALTWAAREAMDAHPGGWEMLTGGVLLTATFYLPRPKSAPRTKDILPVRGLDLDKLLRSIDSLTNAGVWRDDAQVVEIRTIKRYAVSPDLTKIYRPNFHWPQPGCSLRVQPYEQESE